VQLVSKISNLIHERYRRTDRRTDDMQWQYRALHYSALRGKNRGWGTFAAGYASGM